MPISPIQRLLKDRGRTVFERASAFRESVPPEGLSRAEYVAAVLHDVDLALVDGILKMLHRRKIAWVRRTGGATRIYPARPADLSIEQGVADAPTGRLCKAVAGHMLALASAETARREALRNGDHEASATFGGDADIHCARILPIVHRHVAACLFLREARLALHAAFAESALSALTRYEPDLALQSKSNVLFELSKPPRSRRLQVGLSVNEKVFEHIAATGETGATSTRLMQAIRPKPKAAILMEIVNALEADGRIVCREARPLGRGRPARRYFLPQAT